MNMQSFKELFTQATSHPPFSYQERLADAAGPPAVLNAPTGSGKTAAAFFAWLWRRRYHPDEAVRQSTPRRLVYCLPMRVLVEQTAGTIKGYLDALEPDPGIGVHVLMGGEADEEWQLEPERDAVVIGTQDMLLSRALNRGYAMNRFRWPVPFALLNNDAFWVVDELQLMGAGVPTTAQLRAFREKLGTSGPAGTMWMSATVDTARLETADHASPGNGEIFCLNEADAREDRIRRCLEARKVLRPLQLKSGANAKGYPKELAKAALELHRPGRQTLVIVNTVTRAQALSAALLEALGKKGEREEAPEVLLLHSRFRPQERRGKNALLAQASGPQGPGRIVVATQVIEAGVDITSATMVTELAPWPSMVQRFGRCNRYGEEGEAEIYWIDLPGKAAAPYGAPSMDEAREMLGELEGSSAAPGSLPQGGSAHEGYQVLRRKDLFELFDTAPDLSGNDVDVSPFIRDAGETDVYLCWRDWEGGGPPPVEEPRPQREELCPAPIGQVHEFLSTGKTAYLWDYRDRAWSRVAQRDLFPGQVLLMHRKEGGYDPQAGWDPAAEIAVEPVPAAPGDPEESGGDDQHTFTGSWQSLQAHSRDVAGEIENLLEQLSGEAAGNFKDELLAAAMWHDLGKAHHVFQETLLEGLAEDEKKERSGVPWAKAPREPGRPFTHSRPHFRHELASLLALLNGSSEPGLSDLALYLVASHHGKVRLAIRSLPGRDGHSRRAEGPQVILGVEEGDRLPAVDLGGGCFMPETDLSLSAAEMGTGETRSWLSRTLDLLDRHGPFVLAYLETLVRTSDIRASIKARLEVR